MKSKLFLVSVALFLALGLNAQVRNIGAGAGFLGSTRLAVKGDNYQGLYYSVLYRPILGGVVFYEMSGAGASHMFELDYTKGTVESITEGEYYPEGWSHDSFNPAKIITGAYYIGMNSRSAERFQLPIYLGMGISYNDASPIGTLGIFFGAKLHAKFYVTDRLGVWAGGMARYGFGNETNDCTMIQRMLALEAGLTFSL